MIINIDVKSLEWCTYLFLSQDQVGIEEWIQVLEDPTKNDIHTANQVAFNLPSRLISKIFLFRWIYRGSAYAYSKDPDFTSVSKSQDFWQSVIDNYYSKYQSIYETHLRYIYEATTTGKIISPTGRTYLFVPKQTYNGLKYNESDITNWPNQGLGADVVTVIRVFAKKRLDKLKLKSKLVSTVHDSIVLDSPENEIVIVANLFDKLFRDLPKLLSQYFFLDWNVPMRGEIKVGPNMLNLKELNVY